MYNAPILENWLRDLFQKCSNLSGYIFFLYNSLLHPSAAFVNKIFIHLFFVTPQGSPLSLRVYKRYPEGLGEALYREQFDFNAEPPWDPSW